MAEEEIKLTTANTTNGSTNDNIEFPKTPQPEILIENFTSNHLNVNIDKNINKGK